MDPRFAGSGIYGVKAEALKDLGFRVWGLGIDGVRANALKDLGFRV